MSSAGSKGRDGARRYIGPVSLRQGVESAALAGVVAAGAALAWYSDDLTSRQQAGGWSLLVLLSVYLLRRGWIRLFGPVLFYDVVRNTRRTRTFVTRCGYLLLLLICLWSVVGGQLEFQSQALRQGTVDPSVAAALAESFFNTFMIVQLALAIFLTPAYVAGAISEEKERKTLEFVLATDLDSREIVLGKLAARVGYLTLLLLTGLPVLSAVQFLGGVEPDLVFAGFAGAAITVFGLAGIGILASVYARRSRDAILFSYMIVIVYTALCLLGAGLEDNHYITTDPIVGGLSAADFLHWFQAGNPGFALYRVFSGTGGPPQTVVFPILGEYAAFHALLILFTVTLAVIRLRPIALREFANSTTKRIRRLRLRGVRPPGDRPMIWKELNYDSGMRLRRWGLVLLALLVALSFSPVPFILGSGHYGYRSLETDVNEYIRLVGTVVACMALLAAAVRGSVALRVERDKDTLDALLTSPLTTREILFGKWVGCMWGLRWPALWLGSIYALGLLTGGLSPFAVPLLAGVILVYCGTLSMVGLWFSVVCRTTVRATVAAVFASLGLGVGHWLIWMCCLPFEIAGGGGMTGLKQVFEFQAGLTPPFVLAGVLPFSVGDHWNLDREFEGELMAFSLIGTIVWLVVGGILWAITNDRFQVDANRLNVLVPEGHPPAAEAKPSATDAA
jgi:ABC-type transport system involved in multi-copper enzyme maturation permease subunit